MPVTKLDPVSALVVIDMQKGIVALPTIPPATMIIGQVARLAQAFRARGLPVVLVNVTGSPSGRTDAAPHAFTPAADWAKLIPELGQQPSDILVTKQSWSAFHQTALDEVLRARGVTQIVLAGIATSIGVESTARAAFDHGYNVALAVDAAADLDAKVHAYSIASVFPRLGETGLVADVLALLDAR